MKACFSLLLLLLVVSISTAQERFILEQAPLIRISPNIDCTSPSDFDAQVVTIGYDQYMLNLTWDMEYQNDEWIHWDDGNLFAGIGAGVNMSVAARWDSGFLMDYHNYKLSKLRIILYDLGFDSLIVKIWNGKNEIDLIYYDTIYDFYAGSWYVHELESDIYIDASEDLLVGYSIRRTVSGMFPMGIDDGNAITGYSDLIRTDSQYPRDWDSLSYYGYDNSWNIQFYAEDTNGNQKQVSKTSGVRNINVAGYNLYHSLNGGEYELLDFIPSDIDSNYYALPLDASPDLHCYKLTALWTTPMDTCESAPAQVLGNPSADSVCVLLVGEQVRLSDQQNGLRCYPNPFSNEVTIEYYLRYPQTVSVVFYDQFGKEVNRIEKACESGLNSLVWSPENLTAGVYHCLLKTDNGIATSKLILLK